MTFEALVPFFRRVPLTCTGTNRLDETRYFVTLLMEPGDLFESFGSFAMVFEIAKRERLAFVKMDKFVEM